MYWFALPAGKHHSLHPHSPPGMCALDGAEGMQCARLLATQQVSQNGWEAPAAAAWCYADTSHSEQLGLTCLSFRHTPPWQHRKKGRSGSTAALALHAAMADDTLVEPSGDRAVRTDKPIVWQLPMPTLDAVTICHQGDCVHVIQDQD